MLVYQVSEVKRSGDSEDFVYFQIKGETTETADETTNIDFEVDVYINFKDL